MKTRLPQILWVTDHLDDLESDFRVFYRVDDPLDLPATTFFSFAYRVGAYGGVISSVMTKQSAEQEEQGPVATSAHNRREKFQHHGEVTSAASTERSYIHDVLEKA